MKTLYLELKMGAAGDMLTGALLDLLTEEERRDALNVLNEAGIPGVELQAERGARCGITGTHIHVMINGDEEGPSHDCGHEHHHHDGFEHSHVHSHTHCHEHEHEHCHGHDYHHSQNHVHHHSSIHDVEEIIEGTAFEQHVKDAAKKVYSLIAEAESTVHGEPVTEIHFHEVGMKDAIADVLAVCYLMDRIQPDKVVASPVNVGSGQVHCAHGILPVPVPAAAYLLKGIPIYSSDIRGELCTPTGAALIKFFAESYGNVPIMTIESIGYGLGTKDFPAANVVRAMLGES